MKDLVPKFDPKVLDIALFFMIFERQANKENVAVDRWVSQLIPLLPAEVSEIIVKEPVEKSEDYAHIKKLLLKRFRLSAVALREKFEEHTRKAGALWSDLAYELRGYLESWLESVEVNDFESLKELMLSEQIKKRASWETKQHFIDVWDELRDSTRLAEKLDNYESVRRGFKRNENKPWEKRSFGKDKRNFEFR